MLNLESLPNEILIEVLKKITLTDLAKVFCINKKFKMLADPLKFDAICHAIESDANYQPTLSYDDLFKLLIDENGNAKYPNSKKTVFAIQPYNLPTIPKFLADSCGKLYQIISVSVAKGKGLFKLERKKEIPVIIEVDLNGCAKCYKFLLQHDCGENFPQVPIKNYLNKESLHIGLSEQRLANNKL